MADVENRDEWPRLVLDISAPGLRTELKKRGVNLRSVFDKVLKDNEHLAKAYRKRYQQARFCSFLGAVYADSSVYSEEEKTKKLENLKAYYNQEYKKTKDGKHSYLSLTTAKFYCDLLEKISSQIEAVYPGIDLPQEYIKRPLSKEVITQGRGSVGPKDKKTPAKKVRSVVQLYNVMDLSKLGFLSAEQLHEYCETILKKSNNLSEQDKSRLIDLINRIEYAYSHTENTQDDSQLKQHTDKAFDLFAYKEGMSLSPKTQELYVTFIDELKSEIKNHHPDQEISDVEISLLYKKNMERHDPTPSVTPNPQVTPVPPTSPVPPTPTEELHSVYTSDEWNQLLTIASETTINQANGITEGVVVTVLKDVLGDKFPQNWKELSLDEQEKVFEELNPAQVARFNSGIIEKTEKLSELLPPHFLTMMAKNTDNAITSASNEEKDVLTVQRNALVKAMASQIKQYNGQSIDAINAAGVYDGAKEMLEYLSQAIDTDSLPQDISLTKEQIDNVDSVLEDAIKEYDEDHGLTNIDKDSAEKIEKALDVLFEEVKQISDNNEISEYLDEETKSILDQLEFTDTVDEQGNTVSAEENKKLFIEKILYTAAQHTSVANKDEENDEDLKKAFKEQIAQTALQESISLIGGIEAIDTAQDSQKTINNAKTAEEKKAAVIKYLEKFNGKKIQVSKDALSGYFAVSVNKQSLFTNRLANKLGNRGSAIFKKMWKPFEKIDKTCIQRFGKAYTIPRGIFARSLTNLPWTAANAVARVAAFSQIGTPWGMACVAGYGVYSLASTGLRMWRQYKDLKKQDPQLTPGKFFKHNWSGIALSVVGTAASVLPGLSSGVEALQGVTDWMKDSGLLNASSIPGAEQLKMTNLSTIMIGAGLVDSAVKGTIANYKQGNGFLKSLALGGSTAVLSSTVNIGVGMACAYGANELWQTGMNLGADTRTVDSNDTKNELTRDANIDELSGKFEEKELAKLKSDIQDLQSGRLSHEEYSQTLNEIQDTLADKGLTLAVPQNGEQAGITICWREQEAGYSDITINGRTVTEHANHVAADWQRDVPGLHDRNIAAIERNSTIEKFNNENPLMAVDPSRMEMIIMLCGGQAVPANVDTHVNYNQYGDNVEVHGNHRCITDGWLEKYGNDPDIIKYCDNVAITTDEINAIRGLHDQNGNFQAENLTPRLLAVINALDHKVSPNFEVGDLASTRAGAFNDGVLSNNAIANENGEHIHAKEGEGDRYNTYANASSARNDTEKSVSNSFVIKQHQDQYYMPHNPSVDLYNFVKQSKEGGLARIVGENVRATKETDPTRTTIKSQDAHSLSQSSDASRENADVKPQQPKKQGFLARIFKGKGSNTQ